jgi:hypothetical protein
MKPSMFPERSISHSSWRLEFFFNRGFDGLGYLASLIAKCPHVSDLGAGGQSRKYSRAQKHTINAAAPIPTDIGNQKLGS